MGRNLLMCYAKLTLREGGSRVMVCIWRCTNSHCVREVGQSSCVMS